MSDVVYGEEFIGNVEFEITMDDLDNWKHDLSKHYVEKDRLEREIKGLKGELKNVEVSISGIAKTIAYGKIIREKTCVYLMDFKENKKTLCYVDEQGEVVLTDIVISLNENDRQMRIM